MNNHVLKTHLQPPRATPPEVREAREILGLTQAELAHKLGITEYSVYRIERGMRPMTEVITRMLRALVREQMEGVLAAGRNSKAG